MQDLTVLSHEEYLALRQELKDAGIDLCYTAQSARPIHTRWSTERVHEATFQRQVAQRRPADPSYRLASVQVDKPRTRMRPDRLTVTFHAVSPVHETAFAAHLAKHPSRQIDKAHEPAVVDHGPVALKTYVQVAFVLALMTAFEVSLLYLPEGVRPPRWGLTIVLLLVSAFKFGLVASFFMHLRYDNRLYTGFFAAGLVVAACTLFVLLALFREPAPAVGMTSDTPVPIPVAAAATGEVPLAVVGEVPSGIHVFQQKGCGGCHAVASIPGAQGTIGPRLDGLSQRAASRIPAMSAGDYIRQSIEAPNAYVVKGYLKLMPSLRENMSDREFAELLALLRTL